jgi:deazaflavin-dependent oxidoreductase (nitroreductase family)
MALARLKRALERVDEIELTVTGRRSGREISNPVWFVLEDDTLYLLPVRGSDSDWYRNVLKTPTIRVSAGGDAATARAIPITDPTKVREVVEKFRAKYGAEAVEKYYPQRDVAVEVPLA